MRRHVGNQPPRDSDLRPISLAAGYDPGLYLAPVMPGFDQVTGGRDMELDVQGPLFVSRYQVALGDESEIFWGS